MTDAMVALAREFHATLERHVLVAAGTTGRLLHKAARLDVECLLTGPMAGDLQIGALLAVVLERWLFVSEEPTTKGRFTGE
jgi:methylglyoxal synthase